MLDALMPLLYAAGGAIVLEIARHLLGLRQQQTENQHKTTAQDLEIRKLEFELTQRLREEFRCDMATLRQQLRDLTLRQDAVVDELDHWRDRYYALLAGFRESLHRLTILREYVRQIIDWLHIQGMEVPFPAPASLDQPLPELPEWEERERPL